MVTRQLETILSTLSEAGSQGIGLIQLSHTTGIGYTQLQLYLKQHPAYFTQAGQTHNYKINPSGDYKGDIQQIIQAEETEHRQQLKRQKFGWIALLTALTMILINGNFSSAWALLKSVFQFG